MTTIYIVAVSLKQQGGKMQRQVLNNKKGQALGGLGGSVIAVVVAVIILVLGLVIVQQLRNTQATNTEAYLAANQSLAGLGDFADFIPLIVIALAASVIIGLILAGFAFRARGR